MRNHRRSSASLLALAVLLNYAPLSHAWELIGPSVVGRYGEARLDSKMETAVSSLLGSGRPLAGAAREANPLLVQRRLRPTGIWLAEALNNANAESTVDAPDKLMQGEWVVAVANREGKEAADVVGHRLVIDGDGFEILDGDKLLFKGALAVDKSHGDLWRLDVDHKYGEAAGKKWYGVVRVRADGVMEICDNAVDASKPRPESLKSEPGTGTIYLEFRRPKK